MLFLFVIPMLAGFANYIVPLQIGAPDMAFPRINALSFWMLPLAGILMVTGFFVTAAPRPTAGRPTAAVGGDVLGHGHGPLDRGACPDRHELDPRRRQLPGDDLQDARARA